MRSRKYEALSEDRIHYIQLYLLAIRTCRSDPASNINNLNITRLIILPTKTITTTTEKNLHKFNLKFITIITKITGGLINTKNNKNTLKPET